MLAINITGTPDDQFTEAVIRGCLLGASIATNKVVVTTYNHIDSPVPYLIVDMRPMIMSPAQGWLDAIGYIVECVTNPDILSWKVVIG